MIFIDTRLGGYRPTLARTQNGFVAGSGARSPALWPAGDVGHVRPAFPALASDQTQAKATKLFAFLLRRRNVRSRDVLRIINWPPPFLSL